MEDLDLPKSDQEFLAEALLAKSSYEETVFAWYDWLNEDSENPLKVLLYELIKIMLENRGQGGKWEHEDRLPTFETLSNALDSDKYNRFKTKVEKMRNDIEDSARQLIDRIESPEFIGQFDLLEYDKQLELANIIIDQLIASNRGKLFLVKSINAPLSSPLPIFHPEKLLNIEGDFLSEDFPVLRRAGKIYVHYFIKLIPALMTDHNISTFISYAMNVILKYHSRADLGNLDEVYENVLKFEALLIRLRNFHEAHPDWLKKFGGTVAGSMLIFIEAVNLYTWIIRFRENPESRNAFGALKSLAEIRIALHNAHKVFRTRFTKELMPSRLALLTTLVAIYDIATRVIDLYEALESDDKSVAFGYGLEAVGIGTAATIATWAALANAGVISESMAIQPLVGAFITLGALLVTFTGTFLVAYSRDPALETWFACNYFGSNWNDIDVVEEPNQPVKFRWKRIDGTPNLARQISDYLSIFYPLNVEVYMSSADPDPTSRFVRITPALAYHGSHITIKRIIDNVLVPIYSAPINTNQDRFPGTMDRRNIFSPLNPQPGDRLESWFRLITHFRLDGVRTNPSGFMLEIEITICDEMLADLAEKAMINPDVLDEFPIVLRERIRIE